MSAAFGVSVIATSKIASKSDGETKFTAALCAVTASVAMPVPPQVASWPVDQHSRLPWCGAVWRSRRPLCGTRVVWSGYPYHYLNRGILGAAAEEELFPHLFEQSRYRSVRFDYCRGFVDNGQISERPAFFCDGSQQNRLSNVYEMQTPVIIMGSVFVGALGVAGGIRGPYLH